jgi:hypothetical protein
MASHLVSASPDGVGVQCNLPTVIHISLSSLPESKSIGKKAAKASSRLEEAYHRCQERDGDGDKASHKSQIG